MHRSSAVANVISHELKEMVQPLVTRLLYAVFAAVLQVDLAAFVPPAICRVTFWDPLVSSDVSIFSIDCAVSAQFPKASAKALDVRVPVVSN